MSKKKQRESDPGIAVAAAVAAGDIAEAMCTRMRRLKASGFRMV
jgi:hypothetical protein